MSSRGSWAWRRLLARSFAAAMLAAGLGAATADAEPAAVAASAPLFEVRIGLQEGRLAPLPASATIAWRDERTRKIFGHCQLNEETIKRELVDYLQQHLAAKPRLLEQLTQSTQDPLRARELQALVSHDTATRALWEGAEPVPLLPLAAKVSTWQTRLPELSTDLGQSLISLADVMSATYETDPFYADGPLRPRTDDDGVRRAQQGVLSFELMPPLDRAHVVPTANAAQWRALLAPLQTIVEQRVCKLWHRGLLADPLSDYVEARGLAASTVLTPRDHRDATALGRSSLAAPQHANIRVEATKWTANADRLHVGAGRVLLEPDPRISTIYLRGRAGEVMQALYLLLPTSDHDRLREQPARFLCATTTASWSPESPRPAVQLPLDDSMAAALGSSLAVHGQYFTRSQLADRMQRLSTMGYGARLQTFHRIVGERQGDLSPMLHQAWLIVEPADAAAPGEALAGLPACSAPRDQPARVCPKPERSSTADETIPDKNCTFDAKPATVSEQEPDNPLLERRREVPRRHARLGALWPEGQPLRWTASFRYDGLAAGDSFQFGLGQQREALGEASYSRDFVGFPLLGRRLQVTGRVFSEFTPERAIDPTLPDERREGAEVRGLLDLWRDRGGGFGQADIGLARSRLQLKGGGPSQRPTMSTVADINLVLVQSRPRTPANLRTELVIGLARGRADRAGYGRQQVEAVAETMWRQLDRSTLRVQWGRLTGAAPLAEYLPFGGPDSVRGYRDQRASGRRVYSVQLECATPLPWTPDDEGLARFIRRSIGLAVFADMGGVKDSPTGFDGRRASAGLGLRWRYGELVTLRLDAARPVGTVPAGDRGLQIQFGVVALHAL